MSAEEKPRFGTLSVFEFTDEAVAHLQTDNPGGLICFQISPADIEQVQEVMERTGIYDPYTVHSRLAQGRWGYAGRLVDIGKPVTYGWVATDPTSVGSTGLDFVPILGDAYLFDFATAPEQRRHGYYPTLLRFILHDLAKRQMHRAWIATAPGNDVSARSIARAGFLKVADTHIVPSSYTNPTPAHIKLLAAPGVSSTLLELGYRSYVPNNLYKF